MGRPWSALGFIAKSATIGLAIAFLAVLVEPSLIGADREARPAGGSSFADAVAASLPAVANVFTERSVTVNMSNGLTSMPVAVRGRTLGSAVVMSRDGYLVTNWHVVRDADQIRVQLADGRIAEPVLVGADPETELALLKIDLPDLPSVELGRSDTLEVGDVVLAIGNSLGLSQTVTMGIVSATGRGQLDIARFENFIQTDAAINVGNSGGALVNAAGELVGINTAVVDSSGGDRAVPEGIGFAIPVNLVRGVMDQLIEHGRVIRGCLGVAVSDVVLREANGYGFTGRAIHLDEVHGPAAAAGLTPTDILTHIDGERVMTSQEAMGIVAGSQPGDTIRLRVRRPGARVVETDATLKERLPDPDPVQGIRCR